jgi:hypothetical protein
MADGKFIVGKLDVTKSTDAAREYNIQSYPTFIFFHGNHQLPYHGPRTAVDMIAFASRLQSEISLYFYYILIT